MSEYNIIDDSIISAKKIVSFVKSVNPKFIEVEKVINAFMVAGDKYGVRGDIAVCQAIVETNMFRFDSTDVSSYQCNYFNLGISDASPEGYEFESVEEGVTAQIQHLFALATKDSLPLGEAVVNPEFIDIDRGIISKWEDIDRGDEIIGMYHKLSKHECVPEGDIAHIDTVIDMEKSEEGIREKEGIFSGLVSKVTDAFKSDN